MRSLKKTATGVAVVSALCLTAACGSSGGSSGGSASGGGSSSNKSSSSSGSMTKASSDLVGPGCASYAKMEPKGAGSVQGMAQDPVATAASNNPLLKTLVAAVSGKLNPKVNLVNTLNNGKFTVFAPVDDAFAKLPKKTVAALQQPKNAQVLTKILTYHVVPGQLSPSQIDGTHKTAEGGKVKVTGSGDHLMVDNAKVICGGVHTANATVYLINSVLSPQM